MKKTLISLSLISILTSSLLFADKLTNAEKKALMQGHTTVIIPTAGDLANSLKQNKNLHGIQWDRFIDVKIDPSKKYKTQKDKALHLGAKGADAYFLAIAKNSSDLEAVANGINTTLTKIRVNKKALRNIIGQENLKSLETEVKAKRWSSVLKKIAKLKDDIQFQFEKANKQSLKKLNNIGGWIEGYRIAVEGFNSKYSQKDTSVLIQTSLIEVLTKDLKSIDSYGKKGEILTLLNSIHTILGKAKENTLSKAQVGELSKLLESAKSFL